MSAFTKLETAIRNALAATDATTFSVEVDGRLYRVVSA